MRKIGLITGALAVALAVPALAADPEKKKELNSDRPDFTESSITVPRGRLQIETGFTWEDSPDGSRLLSGSELLLRYGVGEHTELRFIAPDYVWQRGRRRASGWGDAAVGIKQELGSAGLWDFAVIAHATLPTRSEFSTGRVDPEVAFTWFRELDERWSVSGLLGFFYPTDGDDRNFTFVPTVSFGYALSDRWGAFLEWAAEFPERGGQVHLLHHGYTYALSDRQQLDVHFGFGLTRAAPDFFIGGGYVVRF